MDFSFFFVRQQTFFPYGFLAFRQIRHIFSCETLFGSFLSLLFQSSIFCCLALEDGSQYPSFSSLIPKIFLLLLHSSVFHASAIFFRLPLFLPRPNAFSALKKIPHHSPVIFFSFVIAWLRDFSEVVQMFTLATKWRSSEIYMFPPIICLSDDQASL